MRTLALILVLLTGCAPDVAPVPAVPSTSFGLMNVLVGTWSVRDAVGSVSGRAEIFRVSPTVVDAIFTWNGGGDADVARFTTESAPGRWTVRPASETGRELPIPAATYCARTLGVWSPCELGAAPVAGPMIRIVTGDSIVVWTQPGTARSTTLVRDLDSQ